MTSFMPERSRLSRVYSLLVLVDFETAISGWGEDLATIELPRLALAG
jgi:hypothetical protein